MIYITNCPLHFHEYIYKSNTVYSNHRRWVLKPSETRFGAETVEFRCVVTQAQRGVSQPEEQGHRAHLCCLMPERVPDGASAGERRAWDLQERLLRTERCVDHIYHEAPAWSSRYLGQNQRGCSCRGCGSGSAALRWLTDGLSAGRAAVDLSSLFTVNDRHTTNCPDRTQVSVNRPLSL